MNDLKFTIDDCDHVIRECLHRNDVKTIDFEVIPRHINNYIFKITYKHGSKQETCCLYAKTKSKAPTIDKIFADYKNTLPQFDTKITPKFCCGKSDLLFFEDLTYQKFQTQPDSPTVEHIERALNVLARFHAAGFAYEESKKCNLKDEYVLEYSNFDIKETEDLLWSLIDNQEKITEIVSDLEERQISSIFRRTLCHGNLSRANLMFHYENGVPNQCKLLNFKCKLYAPPVYDVLQLIFFNTDEDTRQKYFDSFLSHYHSCLKEELEKFNLHIDNFLSGDYLHLSSHNLLPLIKLEVVLFLEKTKRTIEELREILMEPRFSREDCYAITKKKTWSTDYKLLSFSTSSFLKYLKLELKIRQCLDEETIKCFVKSDPKNEELFIYKIFVPKLQEFGIGAICDCLPNCLFHRCGDVIVFEDLCPLGYRSFKSYDSCLLSMAMKKLAKFHACSLLFEERMSEKLKKTYRLIDDYGRYFPQINHPEGSKTEKNEDNLSKCFIESCDRFRNVLCHGYIVPENLLVQYDDDRPIDCRFINYESIKYCPPAFDFLSVIYLTDNIKNEEELKKMYHNELSKIVSSYNYNVNNFFTFQEFTESVESMRLYVLTHVVA